MKLLKMKTASFEKQMSQDNTWAYFLSQMEAIVFIILAQHKILKF